MRTRPLALLALVLTGCFERSLQPVDPCTRAVQGFDEEGPDIDKVDLLLMIDNSNSMTEEQASVVDQVPRIVRILTTGDRDGDGVADFTPPRSLHIGIVDSDMGLGDVENVATCNPGFGDDGLMQTRARHPGAGCMADYASTFPDHVFDFEAGGATSADDFASDVACVATLGTDGCGFEFELDSPLKALSLSAPTSWTQAGYVPPTFYAGTPGHGDDPTTNGDFLRPDSVLGIITINDEDDCSTPNPHIFSLEDPDYASTPLNLRCHVFADELYPVQRYADGFAGLRRNPGLLVYGAITGVPLDLAGLDPAVILADDRMVERVDPDHPDQILSSCTAPAGRGLAYPARRMTELAQQLIAAGANASIQSICNDDFSDAFDAIIGRLTEAFQGQCLPRALNPDVDGNVDCDVLVVLPTADLHCTELMPAEAFTFDHTETVELASGPITREVCRLRQVGRAGAGIQAGWAYDDGNSGLMMGWSQLPAGCGQRVGLSLVRLPGGSETRLQCVETILPATQDVVQLGTACDPAGGAIMCGEGHAAPGNPVALSCDAFDRTCGIACSADADCVSAGLLSYVCDARMASDYFAQLPSGIVGTAVHGFCINPTCGR